MTSTGLPNSAGTAIRPGAYSLAGTVAAALISLILAGCSFGPAAPPLVEPPVLEQPKTISTIKIEEPPPEEPEPEAVTHAIEEDEPILVIDDPWELLAQANAAVDSAAPALLIRAITEFINRGQYYTAQSVVEQLNSYPLSVEQGISVQIIQGQLAAAMGQHGKALALLTRVNPDFLQDPDIRKQVLKTLADSQIALNRKSDAVATLLDLDLLIDSQKQLENQQTLLKLLQSMDPLHLSLLKENSSNSALEGWIALSDTLKTTTPALRQADLNNWRAIYPDHPVLYQLLNQNAALIELDEHKQIALLLPLTSPYGGAARAFYDGFMEAHSNNFSFQPPNVILYDVGEEPFLTSFYYQAAVNEGADFVVGPLGRKAADALLTARKPDVSTLLIADILPGYAADNLYGISLSPEKEARQVADKAFADGHRQATVFRISSDWGNRVADAFIEQWELIGGTVVKSSSFPSDVSDYSRIIQKFLGLDKSIARQRLLEAQVESRLHFSPRRNEDMDVLFLAANAEQSRLVVPQLRFFQAHNLPIYATSYAYSGSPDPAVDADLDGLVLGDMKWMFESIALYKLDLAEKQALKAAQEALAEENQNPDLTESENVSIEGGEIDQNGDDPITEIFGQDASETLTAEKDPTESEEDDLSVEDESQIEVNRNPYQNSALNRLYALGLQSYQLTSRLKMLRNNQWDKYFGEAITVSVAEDGNVVRHPVWAKFSSGLAEPIDPLNSTTVNVE